MTPEREQEIRDRLKIGTLNAYESSLVFSTLDALRQEHERLKDSLEHMTGARDSNQEAADSAYALCAKIERLEAERDSLLKGKLGEAGECLADAISIMNDGQEHCEDPECETCLTLTRWRLALAKLRGSEGMRSTSSRSPGSGQSPSADASTTLHPSRPCDPAC